MLFNHGDEIVGKWRGERIVVQQQLGVGAHGEVYLALWKRQKVVIKIGSDCSIISKEINRLEALNKAQERFPGPRLFAHDDACKNGDTYYFYVMSFQAGVPLSKALHGKGNDGSSWLWIVLQLLHHLDKLHQNGYVFGDWKPYHVLVNTADDTVCFVDIGGVTPIGCELGQWTALYDRAHWQAGLRIAEKSYDLFAVTLLILSEVWSIPLSSIKPEERHIQSLYDIIRNDTRVPVAFRNVFMRTVRGEIVSARHYAHALTIAAGKDFLTVKPSSRPQMRWGRLWEFCFASTVALFLSTLYMVLR